MFILNPIFFPVGVYSKPVVDFGLANQEHNPEVSVDTSRQNADINEQIYALKRMTKKIENAFNGHAVEWKGEHSTK